MTKYNLWFFPPPYISTFYKYTKKGDEPCAQGSSVSILSLQLQVITQSFVAFLSPVAALHQKSSLPLGPELMWISSKKAPMFMDA